MRDQNNKGKHLSKPLTQKKRYIQGGETKIMRKITAYLLIFALVFTLVAPVGVASANTAGEELKDLGIIKGGTGGDLMVNEEWNRQDLVVVLSRLLGEEGAAQATATSHTFQDVTNPFYNSYISWAVGKGLIEGRSATVFGFGDDVTNQEFAAIMLRALGYDTRAAAYANVPTLAVEKGLVVAGTNFAAKSTRGALYGVIVNTLEATLAGSEVTLGAALELDGYVEAPVVITVTEAVAVDANTISVTFSDEVTETYTVTPALVANVATEVEVEYLEETYAVTVTWEVELLEVVSVSAVGAKKVAVEFNMAVEEALTITLFRGIAPVALSSVTWNEEKTVATLEGILKFTKADYTVKTTDLEDVTISIENEKVATVSITATGVQKKAAAPISYEVLNQYGEKVAVTGTTVNVTAVNANTGASLTPAVSGTGVFTVDASLALVEHNAVLTMTHVATGTTAVATLPIVAEAKLGSIEVSAPTFPETAKRITVGSTDDSYKIPYVAYDQYGAKIKLTASLTGDAAIEAADGVKIISSNTTIINPANIKTNSDSELTFQTGATAGTVVLTFVNAATGTSTNLSIVVSDNVKATSLTLVQPTTLATANKAITVDYIATSQFDEIIAKKDFNTTVRAASNITWVSTNPTVVGASHITFNAQNELVITPATTGAVIVTPYVNGVPQQAISFDVQATAVPTKIVGIKSTPLAAVVDGVITIKASNLNVVDQYGQAITLAGDWSAQLKLKSAAETAVVLGDETDFTPAAGAVIALSNDNTTSYAQLKGLAIGNQVVVVTLVDNVTAQPDTALEFTVRTVANTAVETYSFKAVGTLFAASGSNATTNAKTVVVVGKDASGNEIALKPGTITMLTSDNADFGVDVTTMKVWSTKKGTGNISAWINAKNVATIEVTSTDATRVVSEVKFAKASYDVSGIVTATPASPTVTIKDQYGDTIADANGQYFSSDINVATINVTSGQLTIVGAGSITVTYVSGSGVVVTTTVNVTVTP